MKNKFLNLLTTLILMIAAILVVWTGYFFHPVLKPKSETDHILLTENNLLLEHLIESLSTLLNYIKFCNIDQILVNEYNQEIPLSTDLQRVLYEVCKDANVPVALALGLIEVESAFQIDAVSHKGCYGLCQLNPKFFPLDLSPSDNIRAGIGYLGNLLEQYNNTEAALVAYNQGSYHGVVTQYAYKVLKAAEKWSSCNKHSEFYKVMEGITDD